VGYYFATTVRPGMVCFGGFLGFFDGFCASGDNSGVPPTFGGPLGLGGVVGGSSWNDRSLFHSPLTHTSQCVTPEKMLWYQHFSKVLPPASDSLE
jgi:hypothetical protein